MQLNFYIPSSCFLGTFPSKHFWACWGVITRTFGTSLLFHWYWWGVITRTMLTGKWNEQTIPIIVRVYLQFNLGSCRYCTIMHLLKFRWCIISTKHNLWYIIPNGFTSLSELGVIAQVIQITRFFNELHVSEKVDWNKDMVFFIFRFSSFPRAYLKELGGQKKNDKQHFYFFESGLKNELSVMVKRKK